MSHARLSGSKTEQWTICPGSIAYLERFPKPESGPSYHADLGTCAHALVERCLELDEDPTDYHGRIIEILNQNTPDEGISFLKKGAKYPNDPDRVVYEVDDDMIEATNHMVQYVRRRIVELGISKDQMRLEINVTPLPEREDTGGMSDVILDAWPDLIEVVDYKHGQGIFVPVEGNKQLRVYGLGALQEAGADDYENVRYTIVQPRHPQAPSDGVMSEETTAAELLDWKNWLLERAEVVDHARERMSNNASLDDLFEEGLISVGEDGKHCTFCPLLSECPAAMAKAQEVALTEFEGDPEPIEEGPLGPNRLAMLLPWVPFIDTWVRQIEADAENLLLKGGSIEGFKLVRGRSNRRYVKEMEIDGEMVPVDEKHIATALKINFGLDNNQIYSKKLISGPQAEKLIKKSDRKRFNDTLLEKPPGKPTIVPEDDKREALEIDTGFEDP